jgi:hypothetical protein
MEQLFNSTINEMVGLSNYLLGYSARQNEDVGTYYISDFYADPEKPTIEEKRNNYNDNVSFLEEQKRQSENIIQEYNIKKIEINENIDKTIKNLKDYIKLLESRIAEHNKARIGTLEGLARKTIQDSHPPAYAKRYALIDDGIEPRTEAEEEVLSQVYDEEGKIRREEGSFNTFVKGDKGGKGSKSSKTKGRRRYKKKSMKRKY